MGLNFSSPTSLPDKEPLRVGDVEENHQEQIAFTTRTRSRQRIARRLEEEIDLQQADLIFLLCNFVSGLCDSSAYKSWKCFVSMQTGNTVFLGIGASEKLDENPHGRLSSIFSIFFFLLGSLVFSMGRLIGPRKRHTLIGSFCTQSFLIALAAALLKADVIPDSIKPGAIEEARDYLRLVPLSLIAFQSAGQIAGTRLLSLNEIPTIVLTGVYYDIVADPGLLDSITGNRKRNRRFIAIICVLGGAITGGWVCKSTGGISASLWIAAAFKLCIAIAWWFWKECPKLEDLH